MRRLYIAAFRKSKLIDRHDNITIGRIELTLLCVLCFDICSICPTPDHCHTQPRNAHTATENYLHPGRFLLQQKTLDF